MQVKDIAVQGKLKEIAVQWKLKEIAVQYKQYRVKRSQCHTNHSAMQVKDLAVQGLILVDFLGQELIFSRSHLAACSYREVVCGQSRNLFLHQHQTCHHHHHHHHHHCDRHHPNTRHHYHHHHHLTERSIHHTFVFLVV